MQNRRTSQAGTSIDPFISLSTSAVQRDNIPAFEQFQFTSHRTLATTTVSFTIPQGVSFYDVICAANHNYTTHASKKQRRLMLNLLFDGVLHDDTRFHLAPGYERTFEVHILPEGRKKSRKNQVHHNGTIAFDSSLIVVDTSVLLTAATLHMEREILHGREVNPQTGKGDLFDGCIVRTSTEAVRLQIFGLMKTYVGKREKRKNLIVAGTPVDPNSHLVTLK